MNLSLGDKYYLREIIAELGHAFSHYGKRFGIPMCINYGRLYWLPGESQIFMSIIWILAIPIGLLILYWRLVGIALTKWFSNTQIDLHNNGPRRINARKDRFMCIDYRTT